VSECIYILLPVHNRRDLTRKFIDSLLKQTFRNYHLLLIDDGSTDGTEDMVRSHIEAEKLTVIKGKGNWWWAGSLQQGKNHLSAIKCVSSDIILMVNDDSILPPYFLETGCRFLQSHPNTLLQATIHCISGGEILDRGMLFDASTLTFSRAQESDEVNCLTTNGLMMRWADFLDVGNFHPFLLPHYLSDYEFTIRAGRKGLRLVVSSDLNLQWDQETSGIRSYNEDNFFVFLKRFFSRKSVNNPFYWSSFILFSVPLQYIPRHLFNTWRGALIMIGKRVVGR